MSRCKVVIVPLGQVTDRESFHDVFARILGFPSYYGRNMDAWIDLVCELDTERACALHVGKKGTLTLALQDVAIFRSSHPDLWDDLVDSASDVNFRRMIRGESALLALAYQ